MLTNSLMLGLYVMEISHQNSHLPSTLLIFFHKLIDGQSSNIGLGIR